MKEASADIVAIEKEIEREIEKEMAEEAAAEKAAARTLRRMILEAPFQDTDRSKKSNLLRALRRWRSGMISSLKMELTDLKLSPTDPLIRRELEARSRLAATQLLKSQHGSHRRGGSTDDDSLTSGAVAAESTLRTTGETAETAIETLKQNRAKRLAAASKWLHTVEALDTVRGGDEMENGGDMTEKRKEEGISTLAWIWGSALGWATAIDNKEQVIKLVQDRLHASPGRQKKGHRQRWKPPEIEIDEHGSRRIKEMYVSECISSETSKVDLGASMRLELARLTRQAGEHRYFLDKSVVRSPVSRQPNVIDNDLRISCKVCRAVQDINILSYYLEILILI